MMRNSFVEHVNNFLCASITKKLTKNRKEQKKTAGI